MRSGQDRLTCMYGDVAQMVERSLSMWEVGGSIPPVSSTLLLFEAPLCPFARFCINMTKKVFASSGNRTRAARVAGEHSTTEPTMLVFFDAMQQYSSCGRVVKATDSKSVSLWERRFESYQLRSPFFFPPSGLSLPLSREASTDSSIV